MQPGDDAIETRDPDEARELLSRVYCDHTLALRGERSGFAMRQRSGGSARLRTFRLSYGSGDTRVSATPFDDFVLITQPVRGVFGHGIGREVTAWSADHGFAMDADRPHSLHWAQGAEVLNVMLRRGAVERYAAQLYGLDALPTVRIDPVSRRHRGRRAEQTLWSTAVNAIETHLGPGAQEPLSPLAEAGLEHFAVAALFDTFTAHAIGGVASRAGRSSHRLLDRALEFMDAHLAEDVDVGQIAKYCGCGVRTLQKVFRTELDTTPVAQLREMRLERVHRELLDADPDHARVAAVAMGWGFTHLGRFAGDYAARYGEHPRETLSRVR